MANLGDRRRAGNRVAEKFVPASDWTQDDKANYLFVDLPGFKKEELRLELASTGHIIISGGRIVNDNRSIYFQETFRLPENSDMDKICGKCDGDFLHVTVPRLSAATVVENKQQDESKDEKGNSVGENNASVQEEPEENGENQGKLEGGHGGDHEQHFDDNEEKGEISKETTQIVHLPLEMAMKLLKKNKGVILSVVLAFSIGMLVCRTFKSSGGE